MRFIANPHRHGSPIDTGAPLPSVDLERLDELLSLLSPGHEVTPLAPAADLADRVGVAAVHVKDERGRMGLGSFKALGAGYVIAHEAVAEGDPKTSLIGQTYVTASAGNHGLSMAAGARAFGAEAVVYIAETVPEVFAERLREQGATVVREGAEYEASMALAMQAAEDNGWRLLSDSSWPGYFERPHRLMEGYLQMASEAGDQIDAEPTHVFLQAGVGGMAAAVAAHVRDRWGDGPVIVVVEPEEAPALYESAKAGKFVTTTGGVSDMGRLDCKEPSLIALAGLSRDADYFCLLTEQEAFDAMPVLADAGFATSTSGGAGLTGLLCADGAFGLDASSRVLCFLSEGPA